MATSPNFNWPEPDNTDLVKNGALAIRTAVDAIDSSLVDLKGGTTGQVLAKASNTDMDFIWAADAGAPTSLGFAAGKNKIINGDFGIWQRGTSSSTNAAYVADRWKIGFTGTGTTQTMSQQTFTAGTAPVAGYEGTFFARNVVVGGTGTSSLVVMQQPIEDVRTFAGQTVTVSFWAKANTGTPSIGLDLYQEFGSGGSGTVSNGGTKVAITTSWARYSATISLASISGKTIGSSSLLGVRFWFSSGSDYNSLNGTLGLQSNTFDIWGVQVEAGSTATAFQTATGSIQGELAACQRYFFRPNVTNNDDAIGFGYSASTTGAIISIPTPVTMRTTPTYTSDTDRIRGGGSSLTPNNVTVLDAEASLVNISVSQTYTANNTYVFTCRSNASLSAEL
jgi:hypothetical protein